jgi:hypothetical protein
MEKCDDLKCLGLRNGVGPNDPVVVIEDIPVQKLETNGLHSCKKKCMFKKYD